MPAPFPILLSAATDVVRSRITSARIETFSQWWELPAVVIAVVAILALVFWIYRRDSVELSRSAGIGLALLRGSALGCLVAAYLDFERTTEHELVFPSRVAVLVDSSASMTIEDEPPENVDSVSLPASRMNRSEHAINVLESGGLLEEISKTHEVSLWRFDADAQSLAVFPIDSFASTLSDGVNNGEQSPDAFLKDRDELSEHNGDSSLSQSEFARQQTARWRDGIMPRGSETRIGEALKTVVDQEPPGLLAAVVVLSDGANNAGIDPRATVSSLVAQGVRVFPLGIGSQRLPVNVRVADLLVPARVFPGDRFAATGQLQAQGLEGSSVQVELAEVPSDDGSGTQRVIDQTFVTLAADGQVTSVRFDVPGMPSPGRRMLSLRVVPPPSDRSESDNQQAVEIEVVDRVTQVLLLAGGPGREYQFMRNVLMRDDSFAVDVLLQTAVSGASQDARRILQEFPATAKEISEYDAIVAIDPDFRKFDPAAMARLAQWVEKESGGLLLMAGNVFMDAWLADPTTASIRNLYPIELRRRVQLVVDEPAGFDEPMPLEFSRDGQDAEFLWLASSAIASQTVWSEFPGVYSCFDAVRAKPGATVYARAKRLGATGAPDTLPIYCAGQFYGSGSVFYVGSGETWRLRSVDETLYERLSTQLLRHVSQGRLLRGSRRASVLIERDRYVVGSNVVVRIVMPEGDTAKITTCRVVSPDGTTAPMPLSIDPVRSGILLGGFAANLQGTWRIDVTLGDGSGEIITRRVQARLPDRELERPKLDRSLLEQISAATGGESTMLDGVVWDRDDSVALALKIPDRSRREYEAGAPDSSFKERLNSILLACGTGLLCFEWILRRLMRLA